MKVNLVNGSARLPRNTGKARFSRENPTTRYAEYRSTPSQDDEPRMSREGRSRDRGSIDLLQQRDEALKREEALRDRLKLQEAIHTKQMQDLKAQTKKLGAENLKLQRTSLFGNAYKPDKKKDAKGREVRELNKCVDQLKTENQALQIKLDELSDFIRVAGDLKNEAISQCREKNEIILRLREEKEIAQMMRNDEIRRRFQVEGELSSLQMYVEYTERKTREKCRSKSVQTETTIPVRMDAGNRSTTSVGNTARRSLSMLSRPSLRASNFGDTSDCEASYSALTSAAALWKLRSVEAGFQKDSMAMRKKFAQAAHECHGRQRQSGLSASNLHGRHSYPPANAATLQNKMQTKNYVQSKKRDSYDGKHPIRNQKSFLVEYSSKNSPVPPPPPPPPPPKAGIANGSSSKQKYAQHTVAMAPAAIVYNARIDI